MIQEGPQPVQLYPVFDKYIVIRSAFLYQAPVIPLGRSEIPDFIIGSRSPNTGVFDRSLLLCPFQNPTKPANRLLLILRYVSLNSWSWIFFSPAVGEVPRQQSLCQSSPTLAREGGPGARRGPGRRGVRALLGGERRVGYTLQCRPACSSDGTRRNRAAARASLQ